MAETDTKVTHKKYVVLSDAIIVTIGKKPTGRADYTRLLRGAVLNGNPEAEQIVTFLQAGAIKEVRSKSELDEIRADLAKGRASRHRQTAKKAAASMGAPDDPVQFPTEAVLPLPAPLPGTEVLGDEDE